MYESFYGLSGKPFSLLPDADFLFMSKKHKHIVNLLEYGSMTQAGFTVISGEIGSGKTTVLRYYLKRLGPDVTVGLITNSSKTFGHPLQWVATAFGLDHAVNDNVKIYNLFIDFLIKQYAEGKRTILIVDEAQNLTSEMLEDLRMLSNVNNEKDQLLQIILAGQPNLLDTLKRPDLQQLVQRVAVHFHLSPLEPHETMAYIRHRLSIVGGSPDVFDDLACAAIYYFTGGVPRLINLLCDYCLLYGFAEDNQHIGFETVIEAVKDRDTGGLSGFANAADKSPEELLALFKEILKQTKAQ